MAKAKRMYGCTECGATFPKWAGQCGECGAWNTLTETMIESGGAAAPAGRAGWTGQQAQIKTLAEVSVEEIPRFSTASGELDRVLGGGLVDGSVVLIGGDPGIGKSTILLQTLCSIASRMPALYVTGEESQQQVAMRARRLGLPQDQLRVMTETCIESIIATARLEKPKVMVIDSIQTIFTEQLQSAPGGVSQVRESAALLVRYAKQSGTAIFLVGHVTKEGALAGPRVLEHMVDTVLYFEGESDGRLRLLRAVKNRFGAVNELGVFAMTDRGLKEVSNPSAIFLTRAQEEVPGSVVMATWEGTRPMLVEVQALVDDSHLANPRRVTLGLDQNRLAMLLAVLHRHGGDSHPRPGRVPQRCGRGQGAGDRLRPGLDGGGDVQPAQPAIAPRPAGVWRGRPVRRSAPGAQRPGALEGSGQARLQARDRAQGQRTERSAGGVAGDCSDAAGTGARCTFRINQEGTQCNDRITAQSLPWLSPWPDRPPWRGLLTCPPVIA